MCSLLCLKKFHILSQSNFYRHRSIHSFQRAFKALLHSAKCAQCSISCAARDLPLFIAFFLIDEKFVVRLQIQASLLSCEGSFRRLVVGKQIGRCIKISVRSNTDSAIDIHFSSLILFARIHITLCMSL